MSQPSSPEKLQRRVRIAGHIALGNVLGLGLGGALSLVFELPSVSLIGIALAGLAWNEWRGRTQLRAADARAPRRLALNQLLVLLVLIVYCAHGAYVAWVGPSPLDAALRERPDLAEALGGALGEGDLDASLGELNEWARQAALVVYGAVAVGSLLVQGLTTVFYLSLRRALAARV